MVGVFCAGPAYAEDRSEPGFFERLKTKIMNVLDWEDNANEVKESLQKTRENLEKKNREPGYKKSVKNIEKIVDRSSENMEKVLDKNSKRLEKTMEKLTGK